MNVEQVLAAVGAATGISDLNVENAEAKLSEFAASRKSVDEKIATLEDTANSRKAELDTLKSELSSLRERVGKTIDDESAEDRAESLSERIDGLVGKSVTINSETAEALKASLLGAPGQRRKAMLSRADAASPPLARTIIEALKAAPATDMRQFSTGRQERDSSEEQAEDAMIKKLSAMAFGAQAVGS